MKEFFSVWNRVLKGSYSVVHRRRSSDECPAERTPAQVACGIINGRYKSVLTYSSLGIFGLILGTVILLTDPYTSLFEWKSTFGKDGEIFELWRNPPVDVYLRVFLWNVTNKDEFMSGKHDKLHVKEVGPYVYKELMSHENISFFDNGTVYAVPKHPLVWVPEMSEGRREDDLLILPNVALLSIAHVIAADTYFTRLGLNMLIRELDVQPLVQMTAREFMFGYESTLMTLGNNFLSNWIYFDKLGLIDRMYDFEGDYETVYTGETDISKAGLLDTYRGDTKIPQWENPCGSIKYASDGTKFPGNIKPNDTLLFFRKSMCRAKTLTRIGEKVASGLKSYVYTFSDDVDDNGHINDKNKCFCDHKYAYTQTQDQCLPNGILDVHGCYYGFPIALSYPHFWNGDEVLRSKVVGVNPDQEKHKSYFVIEPDSGLPTELAVRYQINMAIGDVSGMANVEQFSNMYLPLLWTESRLYELPASLSTRFQIYINILPCTTTVGMYLFFIGGVFFLCYSIYKFRQARNQKKKFNSPWIEDELSLNINRKLSSYMPAKKNNMSSKELEVYYNSLITPLNQEISADHHDNEVELEDNIV